MPCGTLVSRRLVTDLKLQDIDGLEIVRAVRARPNCPHGVARLLFGSISEAVAGAADIPVLVVRQPVLGMLTG